MVRPNSQEHMPLKRGEDVGSRTPREIANMLQAQSNHVTTRGKVASDSAIPESSLLPRAARSPIS